ncbi:MAG: hypothetical protein JJU45_13630 [Acidimicrobiia bacterium]|nr:hypothetical protein [Acidimicrobiia bacterium]
MGIVVLLIVLALLLGGVGLLVEGMIWLAIIAAAVFVAGILLGVMRRGAAAV